MAPRKIGETSQDVWFETPITKELISQNYAKWRKRAQTRITALIKHEQKTGKESYARTYRESRVESGMLRYGLRFPTATELNKLSWGGQVRATREVIDFLRSETSTVTGEKNYQRKQEQTLKDIGFDPTKMSNEDIAEFFDLYHKFVDTKTFNIMYSGRGDRAAVKAFKEALDISNMNLEYNMKDAAKAISLLMQASDADQNGNYRDAAELRDQAEKLLIK